MSGNHSHLEDSFWSIVIFHTWNRLRSPLTQQIPALVAALPKVLSPAFLGTQPPSLPGSMCFGHDKFLGVYSNQVCFTLKAFTLTMASAKRFLVWNPYSILIFIKWISTVDNLPRELFIDRMAVKAAPSISHSSSKCGAIRNDVRHLSTCLSPLSIWEHHLDDKHFYSAVPKLLKTKHNTQ